MKLRHQILFLLAIPIACQLCTVAVLFQAVGRVDEAATQEAKAKEVLSLTHEFGGLIGRVMLEAGARTFNHKPDTSVHPESIVERLHNRALRLHSLVAGNPKATALMNDLEEETARFITNWLELGQSYDPREGKLFFAQFFYEDEFTASMRVLFNQILQNTDELNELYRPISRELQPEGIAARENLRNAAIAVIIANIVLVLVVAVSVNKQTLMRLQILMNNIRAFSRSEKTFQSLAGQDELAELDQAFRDMSKERMRLDEIQKSLRAIVSHDLRSPLAVINISLETILETKAEQLDEATLRSLRRVSSESHRLARLAKTLLDIDQLEGGHVNVQIDDVSAASIIQSSADAVIALADRKSVKLWKEVDSELVLQCDEERTIQSMVNLLVNAIKFAPANSTVTMRAFLKSPELVQFEVIDEGPGVAQAGIASLFGKFVQLEQAEPGKNDGSGLGLYICRLLLEAQGGTIGYTKPGDTGSCFWFELPVLSRARPLVGKQGASVV